MTSRPAPEFGLGLWAMRSTVYAPRSWTALYRGLRDDAVLAERLGFDTLWLAEHHGWYDGWCPQVWVAAASVLGATHRIRVGSAMYLLPQHDVRQTVRDLRTLLGAFGDRVQVGTGVGYRDEEFDIVGLHRSARGRRMDESLDVLVRELSDGGRASLPIWIGGFSDVAIRRAASRGLSLLLPNTLRPEEIAANRQRLSDACAEAGTTMGRVGVMVDIWPTDDANVARERIVRYQREYAGAFFTASGQPLFDHPEQLDRQSARVRRSCAVGAPDELVHRLVTLYDAGADVFVLNVRFDFPDDAQRDAMTALARSVLPAVHEAQRQKAGVP